MIHVAIDNESRYQLQVFLRGEGTEEVHGDKGKWISAGGRGIEGLWPVGLATPVHIRVVPRVENDETVLSSHTIHPSERTIDNKKIPKLWKSRIEQMNVWITR